MKKIWIYIFSAMFVFFWAWEYRTDIFEIMDAADAKNSSLNETHKGTQPDKLK